MCLCGSFISYSVQIVLAAVQVAPPTCLADEVELAVQARRIAIRQGKLVLHIWARVILPLAES
jgi:hypothetical protein